MISAINGWRKKTIPERVRSRSGFTLMEVMVALAIFSMTVTVVFVIFNNSIRQRQTGEGYGRAVALVDAFLAERKLKRDGVDFFFPPSTTRAIREGRPPAPDDGVLAAPDLVMTNIKRVYRFRLRGRVLERDPLIYRAFLTCIWKVRKEGEEREEDYAVSTVFVHPVTQATNR